MHIYVGLWETNRFKYDMFALWFRCVCLFFYNLHTAQKITRAPTNFALLFDDIVLALAWNAFEFRKICNIAIQCTVVHLYRLLLRYIKMISWNTLSEFNNAIFSIFLNNISKFLLIVKQACGWIIYQFISIDD